MNRKRVAILISGRGSNMSALIAAARQPDYPAEIVLVISNRHDAAGLAAARAAGVTTTVVDHTVHGKDRLAFEGTLQAALAQHDIALICLAGFMRLLSADFVTQWQGRIINIHPALLPTFKGLDTHRRALEAGVKIHGATVHFVVPEMDSGPIVAQAAVPVHEDDTEQSLGARVLAVEHRVYPLALKLVAAGQVTIERARCRITDAPPPEAALVVPSDRD